MNKAILIGNLVREVDLKYVGEKGTPVATFTIAISRPRRNGQDQGADFLTVVAWNKLADNCATYLKKGRQCAVEGRIQTRNYEKDGQKRYITEILADNVQFLGGGSSDQNNQRDEKPAASGNDPFADPFSSSGEPIQIDDSDIPF